MAPSRKRGGIGAVGSAKMNAVHPRGPLKERYRTVYERGVKIVQNDKGKVSSRGRVRTVDVTRSGRKPIEESDLADELPAAPRPSEPRLVQRSDCTSTARPIAARAAPVRYAVAEADKEMNAPDALLC